MKIRREMVASALLLAILAIQPMPISIVYAQQIKGPRVDDLLVKIYPNSTAELAAFNASEIDIVDTSMDPSLTWNRTIPKPYETGDMYDLEVNNNKTVASYSGWTSPTWDVNFRHALAHLANKSRYVSEVLNGWGVVLDTPVMPWLTEWFNPGADKHPFNRTEAARILDASGYVMDPTDIRVYPPWHEKAGQPLDPLIFYGRVEDARATLAQMFTDELLAIGIPVNLFLVNAAQAWQKVMIERDYHLYTGAMPPVGRDPYYLYSLYHTDPGSKDLISDPELDYWLERLVGASDRTVAQTAAWAAQRRLAEIAGTIPLWTSKAMKAHKEGWAGTVNQKGFGIDSWWTFINSWPYNYTDPNHPDLSRPWTLRYGHSSDVAALNPLYSMSEDWLALDKVYDTLTKENPFDPTMDLPWMASSWTVDTWVDPDGLQQKTKLTFNLSGDIYWHTSMPPAPQLTSTDVKFTIEYLRNYTDAWNYWRVADVHHIETPDALTVVVYENTLSFWTLHWIGELPIIPKHIWENIGDPHGFMPDPTLTGSGPFKFSDYTPGSSIVLLANRQYFMPFHPKGDTNFDKIIDIFDLVIVALAFGSQIGDPNWDQRADIAARYLEIDIFDLVRVALDFGTVWLPDP